MTPTARYKPIDGFIRNANPLGFVLYLPEVGASLLKYVDEWAQYERRIAAMEREIDFLRQKKHRIEFFAAADVADKYSEAEISKAKKRAVAR